MDENYPESLQAALAAINSDRDLRTRKNTLAAIDAILDKNWTDTDKVALIAAVLDAHDEANGRS